MEPSAVRVTGVSTVNVYQEIEWHSPKSMAVGGNGSRKFIWALIYRRRLLSLRLFFSFDQCSRACGGGVQSSTRDCNNPSPANGGKYCVGTRIKYRSCNIQDCPPDAPDFREQQCAEMNNNNFGIPGLDANVRWVPKYGQSPHDECKLYCRVEKSNNYFLLNDKVRRMMHFFGSRKILTKFFLLR